MARLPSIAQGAPRTAGEPNCYLNSKVRLARPFAHSVSLPGGHFTPLHPMTPQFVPRLAWIFHALLPGEVTVGLETGAPGSGVLASGLGQTACRFYLARMTFTDTSANRRPSSTARKTTGRASKMRAWPRLLHLMSDVSPAPTAACPSGCSSPASSPSPCPRGVHGGARR